MGALPGCNKTNGVYYCPICPMPGVCMPSWAVNKEYPFGLMDANGKSWCENRTLEAEEEKTKQEAEKKKQEAEKKTQEEEKKKQEAEKKKQEEEKKKQEEEKKKQEEENADGGIAAKLSPLCM